MNLQPRCRLNHILHASRIIHTWQLDQDLIAAKVVLLNHRLAYAQRVNARADYFDRLLQRPLLDLRNRRRLHRQRPGVVRTRADVVLRPVLGLECAADITAAIRRRTGDLDCLRMTRIRLGYRSNRDAVLLQILLDVRQIAVRADADRLIHHDLQNQVRSALEIEPEVNAVEDRVLESGAAQAMRNANDPNNKEDQDGEDRNSFRG